MLISISFRIRRASVYAILRIVIGKTSSQTLHETLVSYVIGVVVNRTYFYARKRIIINERLYW